MKRKVHHLVIGKVGNIFGQGHNHNTTQGPTQKLGKLCLSCLVQSAIIIHTFTWKFCQFLHCKSQNAEVQPKGEKNQKEKRRRQMEIERVRERERERVTCVSTNQNVLQVGTQWCSGSTKPLTIQFSTTMVQVKQCVDAMG